MGFVAYQIEWQTPLPKDAVTLEGETKTELFERFGKSKQVPDEPSLQGQFHYLLDYFSEIASKRQPSATTIAPIQFTEILAWQKLRQIVLTPLELDILLQVDDAVCSIITTNQTKRLKDG